MMNLLTTLSAAAFMSAFPLSPVALQASAPAPAQIEAAPAAVTQMNAAERSRLLKAASKALADVKTARGTFEQVSPDYSVSTGRFALSRPGKVRFEYDDPVPLLIVSDGTTVAQQDTELETTDRIPLSTTPLALLLDDKLDFAKEANIIDVVENDSQYAITINDPDGEMDGTLQLIFNTDGNKLDSWVATDSGGNATKVRLANIVEGKRLNPKLFILRDFDEQ